MKFLFKSRDIILATIFFTYLLPLIFLVVYSFYYAAPEKSWVVLSLGLFLTSIGAVSIYCLLTFWEKENSPENVMEVNDFERKIVDFPSLLPSQEFEIKSPSAELNQALEKTLAEAREELSSIQIQLSQKDEEISFLQKENQKSQKYADMISQEFSNYKNSVQHQFEQHTQVIENSQETIAEQRSVIEKKHLHIAQLETKVRDLTYEIKTLLQLAEIANQSTLEETDLEEEVLEDTGQLEFNLAPLQDPDKDLQVLETATVQLKRCVDIAQKITGGSHYRIGSPRFRELAGDNYTLDLRRLFDSLRTENNGLVLFYSQKENKVLFASNQVKTFLGWGADKFLQSFFQIIEPSLDTWKNSLSQLAFRNQAKVDISMKNKTGQEILMHGMLGIVPTGIFRNHILGVLYPKICEVPSTQD